jgi:hypothetical protein
MQLMTSATFSKLQLDDLEDQIISLAARINASELYVVKPSWTKLALI